MLDNLNTVLESVSEKGLGNKYTEGVVDWLHIPVSKQRELQQQHKWAYSAYYLAHHPGPSWRIIANALWQEKELGTLEVVQKLYLKGEPCADSCRSEGRIGSLCTVIIYNYCTLLH